MTLLDQLKRHHARPVFQFEPWLHPMGELWCEASLVTASKARGWVVQWNRARKGRNAHSFKMRGLDGRYILGFIP